MIIEVTQTVQPPMPPLPRSVREDGKQYIYVVSRDGETVFATHNLTKAAMYISFIAGSSYEKVPIK